MITRGCEGLEDSQGARCSGLNWGCEGKSGVLLQKLWIQDVCCPARGRRQKGGEAGATDTDLYQQDVRMFPKNTNNILEN